MSPRAIVMWLIVVMVAFGVSVRPKPLAMEDLYASEPTPPPTAAHTEWQSNTLTAAQPGVAPPINWRVLASLDYVNGRMSDTLRVLNGQRIRVPGFVVPLDDFQDVVKEFLLVPYFGACVHTPPPPPNQIVYVRMRGGRQKVSLFEPVWIEGVLMVKQVQSIYGAVGFQLVAERISPYR